jgi:predicted cupin superfamily sugar epimerase
LTRAELVESLGLAPHPEGGFFRETYRAAERFTPEGIGAPRAVSTAILYLLGEGDKSRLHRIKSDELWHYHLGGGLRLTQLLPGGRIEETLLGPDLAAGQKLQHAVPAGAWFGAEPLAGAGFCLVGCTVAPGFDFADFELGKRNALVEEYPLAREAIVRLTPEYGCF